MVDLGLSASCNYGIPESVGGSTACLPRISSIFLASLSVSNVPDGWSGFTLPHASTCFKRRQTYVHPSGGSPLFSPPSHPDNIIQGRPLFYPKSDAYHSFFFSGPRSSVGLLFVNLDLRCSRPSLSVPLFAPTLSKFHPQRRR